jgi:hypothetical protein
MSERVETKFIVGIPRSGSTLWTRIIQNDESILAFNEMHFLSRNQKDFRHFIRAYAGDLSTDTGLHKLIEALMDESCTTGLRGGFWISLRNSEPDKLAAKLYARLSKTDRSLPELFRALIEEVTLIRGYSRCIVKFPLHIMLTNRLFDWCPNSPVIHISRDPCALAASKTNDPGGTARRLQGNRWLQIPLRVLTDIYIIHQYNISARVHASLKGKSSYDLYQYEDLMQDPQAVLNRLCKFAGLSYSDAMHNPKPGQKSSLTGEARGGLDRVTAARWQQTLTVVEARVIRSLTAGASRRLGYAADAHPVYQKMEEST